MLELSISIMEVFGFPQRSSAARTLPISRSFSCTHTCQAQNTCRAWVTCQARDTCTCTDKHTSVSCSTNASHSGKFIQMWDLDSRRQRMAESVVVRIRPSMMPAWHKTTSLFTVSAVSVCLSVCRSVCVCLASVHLFEPLV